MMVGPCSKGSCRSLNLSSGLLGGSIVSDNPLISPSSQEDCPLNSPKATTRIKVIELLNKKSSISHNLENLLIEH